MGRRDAAEPGDDRSVERQRHELERENDRLETLLEILDHDLRNQLAVAVGRLELARRERDDEDLEAVATAHERMEALLEDLLAYKNAGFGIDGTEPVALADRSRRSWDAVAPPAAELVLEADVELEADPGRLDQLLRNLFGNALEHAHPRGAGATTITVGPLTGGDGFFVEDDGRGLPDVQRESLFEAGVSTAADGRGLGLAIVEDVVEAHGWRVDATAGRGGGARFEISGVDVAVNPPSP